MGVDICIHVEIRTFSKGQPTGWKNADRFSISESYDPATDPPDDKYREVSIYWYRNYDLFKLLVGDLDNEQQLCVHPPRGFPDDASPDTIRLSEYWRLYPESYYNTSWLTLKEMVDFQATGPMINYNGYVSKEAAAAVDERREYPSYTRHEPDDYNTEYREGNIPCNYMEELIDRLTTRLREDTYKESSDLTPEDLENLRIVFSFNF